MQQLLEEMSGNAEERVNLQQALFEVEAQNEANLWQAEQLDDEFKSDSLSASERAKMHARYAEVGLRAPSVGPCASAAAVRMTA